MPESARGKLFLKEVKVGLWGFFLIWVTSVMFISKKVPRCSEGSVHPQTHWIQPGLQRRGFFSEIYENFSSWSKVFQ